MRVWRNGGIILKKIKYSYFELMAKDSNERREKKDENL